MSWALTQSCEVEVPGYWQIVQSQRLARTHMARSPSLAMPYLAKEFTEIWWWVVVFQQRSNCLKDNKAVSVRTSRENSGEDMSTWRASYRGHVYRGLAIGGGTSAPEGWFTMGTLPPCHRLGRKTSSLTCRSELQYLGGWGWGGGHTWLHREANKRSGLPSRKNVHLQ